MLIESEENEGRQTKEKKRKEKENVRNKEKHFAKIDFERKNYF